LGKRRDVAPPDVDSMCLGVLRLPAKMAIGQLGGKMPRVEQRSVLKFIMFFKVHTHEIQVKAALDYQEDDDTLSARVALSEQLSDTQTLEDV
jgi:hypothetical protein